MQYSDKIGKSMKNIEPFGFYIAKIIFLVILTSSILGGCAAHRAVGDGLNPGKFKDMMKNAVATNAKHYQSSIFNGRKYLFYTPDQSGIPLLIILHGGLGNPDLIASTLNMRPVAESNGFAVAYLSGTGGRFTPNNMTWNAGGGCCGDAARLKTDDVSYIESFIREMIKTREIDPKRVFILGYSNGSMMAYRLMCEKGNVAGVLAISGPLMVDACPNASGVNVLHIHGRLDDNVPVEGGYGSKSRAKIKWNSVSNTEQMLKSAGTNVSVKILPDAGHGLPSIMKSVNLPEIITQFMFLTSR